MEDTQSKTITIEGIENKYIESLGATVFELKTDSGKYSFFTTKKDGAETKAYEQFQKFGFKSGDSVEVVYKESTGKPYINKNSMKEVTPINKTIVFFVTEDGGNSPVVHSAPKKEPVSEDEIERINGELMIISDKIKKIEEAVGITKEDYEQDLSQI